MAADLCALALQLGLSCLPHTVAGPVHLTSNYIACRKTDTVAALHRSGDRFQRVLDDAMASGDCRHFASGTTIRRARVDGTLQAFTEPGTGRRYFTFTP